MQKYKTATYFKTLALSTPIFNKKSDRTQAEERLKVQDPEFCFIKYSTQSLEHSQLVTKEVFVEN